MRNSISIKVAAVATSIALAVSGGTALAEEAAQQAEAPTEAVSTTDQVSDATEQATTTPAKPDSGSETETADQVEYDSTDPELEAQSTITASTGEVLDLNSLGNYEPTPEELVDSLISEYPQLAKDRDKLLANYNPTSVDENMSQWFDSDYKYLFIRYSILEQDGRTTGAWCYYSPSKGKWIHNGNDGAGAPITSGTSAGPESFVNASTVGVLPEYVSGTVEVTPAVRANYDSPTAGEATESNATTTTATAAIPETGDPTSMAGAVAALASSLGVFGAAGALRRRH